MKIRTDNKSGADKPRRKNSRTARTMSRKIKKELTRATRRRLKKIS